MRTSNSKQRLFEIMGRVDKSFKPKLNEDVFNDAGEPLMTHQQYRDYSEPSEPEYDDSRGDYEREPSQEDIINDLEKHFNTTLHNYDDEYAASVRKPNPEQQKQLVDEKMIGQKPRGKRDDVANYKGSGAFPGYTHFAVLKDNNKIINGWDYRGYDSEELKLDKRHYFYDDIKDMQFDPKITKVVTANYLQKQGINPFDFVNWLPNEEYKNYAINESVMQENRQGFKRMIIFWMYDKEGSYLGDLDPIDEEGNYMNDKSEVLATPEFQKFSQEKNITAEQIGKITRSREYMMDGEYLEKQYYAPSQSEELYDPKTNTWYNLSGQQMRDPSEYERYSDGTNQWGERYEDD